MTNHCPLDDLNLFACTQAKKAMQSRIERSLDSLKKYKELQKNQLPLWIESVWQHTGKPLKIKRLFFIWKRPFMSPHDVIADAESRIKELDQRIALLTV